MNKVIKERDYIKENLKILYKDYLALRKANKYQHVSKSLTKWEAKLAALNKEFIRITQFNRDKLINVHALASTL